MFNASHAPLVKRPRPPKLDFGHKKIREWGVTSWNSWKYYATKIWSYTVFGNTYEFNIYLAAIVSGWTDSGSQFIGHMLVVKFLLSTLDTLYLFW